MIIDEALYWAAWNCSYKQRPKFSIFILEAKSAKYSSSTDKSSAKTGLYAVLATLRARAHGQSDCNNEGKQHVASVILSCEAGQTAKQGIRERNLTKLCPHWASLERNEHKIG